MFAFINIIWFNIHIDNLIGDNMKITDRKFGIEIEAGDVPTHELESALNRAFAEAGLDMTAEQEGYNHITRTHWKITSDASVEMRNPFEVVSPILQGQNGLDQLKVVCATLNELGARVNVSCGLHVHLNATDLTVGEILSVYNRYADFGSQIDTVVSPSRRGEGARYVSKINKLTGSYKSKQRLANARGKYHKVNLVNVSERGTIEFRQHQGTTDFEKITNWLSFLQSFVEASRKFTKPSTPKNRVYNQLRTLFENNGFEVEYDRYYKEWRVENESETYYFYSHNWDDLYDGARESSLNRPKALDYLATKGLVFSSESWEPQVEEQNSETDSGWLHDVDEEVVSFLEQRQLDLS